MGTRINANRQGNHSARPPTQNQPRQGNRQGTRQEPTQFENPFQEYRGLQVKAS